MDINSIINKQIESYVKYDKKILKIKCITALCWREDDEDVIRVKTDLSTFFLEVDDNKIEEYPGINDIYRFLNLNCKGDYDDKLYTKYQRKNRDGEIIEEDLIDLLLKNAITLQCEYSLDDKEILNVLSAQYIN